MKTTEEARLDAGLHDRDFRVRLTQDDYDLLRQLALRNGYKPAQLARHLITSALDQGVVRVSPELALGRRG